MKLILKEDVPQLGSRGTLVNVARGYARNFLVPQGLAIEASEKNVKLVESEKRIIWAREAKDKESAELVAAQIGAIVLKIYQKAGESEKLYGSVTSMDLAAKLAEKGVEVDRKKIILPEPIKALGTYEIPVKLHAQVQGKIKVEVLPEE
ncbi:MAG: 50S ribosomal protein L9 [Deltaproteobacteria bacterium]|nr:50S ribosomal protein L9 [Deltaproteobacteria bacterium]